MISRLSASRLSLLPRLVLLLALVAVAAAVLTQLRTVEQQHVPLMTLPIPTELPDFQSYDSVDARKEAFVDFLYDFVVSQNARLREKRERLTDMRGVISDGYPLSRVEQRELRQIAGEYDLGDSELSQRALLDELLLRVDVIPPSLALAQAAIESAWGTSRFARQGNNLFGQWCFSEGCGLVPEQRASDAEHEVRAFASVQAAVQAYFHNLNTNSNYREFRQMRAWMHQLEGAMDSMTLAMGLNRYSGRGHAYVEQLRSLIRSNDLTVLDRG